jgi:hypothetical protein
VLQAKLALRRGENDNALSLLKPVFAELKPVPPALRLVYAEAIGTKKDASAKDKDDAAAVLKEIKDQVPAAELSRVAAAIDPKLPKELGVAEPAAAQVAAPPKPPERRRHR